MYWMKKLRTIQSKGIKKSYELSLLIETNQQGHTLIGLKKLDQIYKIKYKKLIKKMHNK
jgi:hypothetical protein